MRELQQLGVIMNLQTGNSLLLGHAVSLKINTKKQLLLDFHDVFQRLPALQTLQSTGSSLARHSLNVCELEPNVVNYDFQQDSIQMFTTDMSWDPCSTDYACQDVQAIQVFPMQTKASPPEATSQSWQQHLSVNSSQLMHLIAQPRSETKHPSSIPACESSTNHGGQQVGPGSSGSYRSGCGGSYGGKCGVDISGISAGGQGPLQGAIQEGQRTDLGRESACRAQSIGPSGSRDLLALHGSSHQPMGEQPSWPMGGVQQMRSEVKLHPGDECTSHGHRRNPSSTRVREPRDSPNQRVRFGDHQCQGCETSDQDRGFGACGERHSSEECWPEEQAGQKEESRRRSSAVGRLIGQRVRGGWQSGAQECKGGQRQSRGPEGSQGSHRCGPSDNSGDIGNTDRDTLESELHESDQEVMSLEDVPEKIAEQICEHIASQPESLDAATCFRMLKTETAPMKLWEICCGPNSTLASECQRQGFSAERFTLSTGYDLDKESTVKDMMAQIVTKAPNKLWASPKCTPWTPLQNLNQRTEAQCERLRKLRLKSRRQLRHILKLFRAAIDRDPNVVDVYFEWPTGASDGWSLEEFRVFEDWLFKKHQRRIYYTRIDGCMFGMCDADSKLPIRKLWTVMSTDEHFHQHAWATCDGTHDHQPLLGLGSTKVSQTAFYPPKLARRIVQVWKGALYADTGKQLMQELNVLDSELREMYPTEMASSSDRKRDASQIAQGDAGMEQPHETQQYDTDAEMAFPHSASAVTEPQGQAQHNTSAAEVSTAEREQGRALLHKLHRAAGHPSNRALARLCRDRKLPKWLVGEAEHLQCPACVEAEKGTQPVPRKSLGQHPVPWQFVGLDVLELAMPAQNQKTRYLLMTCLSMRFVSVVHLWTGNYSETGTDPGTRLVEAFCNGWLMHRPRPEWCVVDSQSSLRYGAFPTFLSHAGIGLTVVPGEAHWIHGKTEAMVQVMKRTMRRIRNEYPSIAPSSLAALATYAQNHTDHVAGFSPIQWAYGVDPDSYDKVVDPLNVNREHQLGPEAFQDLHRLRDRASAINIEERARESFTRLLNSSPKPLVDYRVGDFVCIWRNMTLKARKRDETYNPEARFIGPGRIVLIEPAVLEDRNEGIIWVLFGTTLYRCAVEQLRPASQQEVTLEIIRGGEILAVPKTELLQRLKTYVDVTKEKLPPDHPEYVQRERSRSRERRRKVEELRTSWDELVGINEARRRDGLPPLMNLPQRVQAENFPSRSQPEIHHMAEQDRHLVAETQQMHAQPSELLHLLQQRIFQLEQEERQKRETDELREQIQHEKESEHELMCAIQHIVQHEQDCKAFFVEFDVENEDAMITNPLLYTKHVLESKSAEVSYRNLREDERPLFDEAKARELSEVASSQCLRAVQSRDELKEAYANLDRHIPMRWVLTWKPIIPPEKPTGTGPTTVSSDGSRKAKARVVLIGFKHPDLVKRNPITGKPELLTSSPTISRTGRNLLLQSMAFDRHRMESADAKSAFLQAENREEGRRIWTGGVPELAVTLGVPEARLYRVLGAIYGLTNAPRIFWADADTKFKALGAQSHALDRCIWIFKDRSGTVCGRIGSQVDDFLIGGIESSPEWQHIRSKIKGMYQWSPWQSGDFIYSGSRLRQMSNYTIHVSQEDFCNSLKPVEIAGDKARGDEQEMSDAELSQCRALLMKAQWRALQTAPQYAARIGVATSAMKDRRLHNLREANSIVRELKKRSKEDLVFHNFHESHGGRLTYKDLVFVHWADAGQPALRRGGYVTGISSPKIMQGVETPVSLIDWRSWKLKRPSVGTNASEGQALYEAEDKGWRTRLFWALLYGHELKRGQADDLTSMFLSLLVTDSRGCYDLLVTNESLGMSTENAKTATDLLSVKHGIRDGSNCYLTWVPGDINLADGLTKVSTESFRTMALYHERKAWVIRFNEEFVSARKQQRLRREQQKAEAASSLHLADMPDTWCEDPWLATFGTSYER